MNGNTLEDSGWRQAVVVKQPDIRQLLETSGIPYEEGIVALVASQSCDIANNNLQAEPFVELSLARKIDRADGMLTHNKNPRALHIEILRKTGDRNVSENIYFALRAHERIAVPKKAFENLEPDSTMVLEERQAHSYSSWLAARYSRPAHPSSFNSLISKAAPKNKLKDKAKKGNIELAGIYIQLTPDAELKENQNYAVTLLGLLPAGFNEDRSNAQSVIDTYASTFREAGMEVTAALRTEDEISVAVIRRFKRLYLDDLSFRQGTQHPIETDSII